MFERATRTFVSECFLRSPRRSAPYLVLSSRRGCRRADSPSCLGASFCTRHISPVTDTITPRQRDHPIVGRRFCDSIQPIRRRLVNGGTTSAASPPALA